MDELIIDERDDVAIVTLNRPFRKNALSLELMAALTEFFLADSNRGVVLTGAGDVFCSGIDTALLPEQAEEALSALTSTILRLPAVVVAALNGPCLGGAVELAMSCDVRVGSPSTFFEIPAARLGILYRPDGLQLLASRLSQQILSRLLLLNERIGAATAEGGGLLSCVSVDVVGAALTMLSAEGLDPEVVAATKGKLLEIATDNLDITDWDHQHAEFLRAMAERPG
jgi:enoyl-CoA hydratase/carnithine racemase